MSRQTMVRAWKHRTEADEAQMLLTALECARQLKMLTQKVRRILEPGELVWVEAALEEHQKATEKCKHSAKHYAIQVQAMQKGG